MPTPTAGAVKDPCQNCRERHAKCDEQRPKCGRCGKRGLACVRAARNVIFRPGSSANYDANFGDDQRWVNSRPRNLQLDIINEVNPIRNSSLPPADPNDEHRNDPSTVPQPALNTADVSPTFRIPAPRTHGVTTPDAHSPPSKRRRTNDSVYDSELLQDSPTSWHGPSPPTISFQDAYTQPVFSPPKPRGATGQVDHQIGVGQNFGFVGTPSDISSTGRHDTSVYSLGSTRCALQSFESVQEACLLRYFTEELSPWFDICDEGRHFQLAVPQRARRCPPLLNAVFAVSARHLNRLPQYKTPQGIVYQGQLLPDLTDSTAVEYMLKCIPALLEFHNIRDKESQENVIAAVVILRQYEEMEEDEMDMDGDIHESYIGARRPNQKVNFLSITQAIIETTVSSPIFPNQELANAAFWATLTQDIYYAFTRERPVQMNLDPEKWQNAPAPNKLVMHAADVTKWRWGNKSEQEWSRLNAQQEQLSQECASQIVPCFERKADHARGEIFPTIWYASDAQVTGIQHFELARMVLIAENPNLESTPNPRAAHRKVEAQVRSIVLKVCGIALSHSYKRLPPVLINAVIGILLYGEYFTEQREREALMGVLDQTGNVHAWPMRKPVQVLRERWDGIGVGVGVGGAGGVDAGGV